jgi:hypothetical protein
MKYTKSDLPEYIRREIKRKEKDLGRTCRTIWDFTNPKDETFLFGSFCKNYDRLIVTIAYRHYLTNSWMYMR